MRQLYAGCLRRLDRDYVGAGFEGAELGQQGGALHAQQVRGDGLIAAAALDGLFEY